MKSKRFVLLISTIFIILCFICFLCVVIFRVFTPFVLIEGPSMEPNYSSGELWVLNRFDNIDRYDVVVFKKPGREDLIKRVVGLPGEKIEIKEGYVYINNNKLDEPYLDQNVKTKNGDLIMEDKVYIIPANSYFVMGDNRSNSLDSRYSGVGYIKKEWIEGELLFEIW